MALNWKRGGGELPRGGICPPSLVIPLLRRGAFLSWPLNTGRRGESEPFSPGALPANFERTVTRLRLVTCDLWTGHFGAGKINCRVA